MSTVRVCTMPRALMDHTRVSNSSRETARPGLQARWRSTATSRSVNAAVVPSSNFASRRSKSTSAPGMVSVATSAGRSALRLSTAATRANSSRAPKGFVT